MKEQEEDEDRNGGESGYDEEDDDAESENEHDGTSADYLAVGREDTSDGSGPAIISGDPASANRSRINFHVTSPETASESDDDSGIETAWYSISSRKDRIFGRLLDLYCFAQENNANRFKKAIMLK